MNQDQRELESSITQRLTTAVTQLDVAQNMLQMSGDKDLSLDQLSQADRNALVATHASIARAHTEIALVQSQAALLWQLQELTDVVGSIAHTQAYPPTADAALVDKAFPTR